jgi:hypothetical protein
MSHFNRRRDCRRIPLPVAFAWTSERGAGSEGASDMALFASRKRPFSHWLGMGTGSEAIRHLSLFALFTVVACGARTNLESEQLSPYFVTEGGTAGAVVSGSGGIVGAIVGGSVGFPSSGGTFGVAGANGGGAPGYGGVVGNGGTGPGVGGRAGASGGGVTGSGGAGSGGIGGRGGFAGIGGLGTGGAGRGGAAGMSGTGTGGTGRGGSAGTSGSGTGGVGRGGAAGTSGAGGALVCGSASGGFAGATGIPSSWRLSDYAYCAPPGTVLGHNPIWSDGSAVHLVTSTSSAEATIQRNSGDGWAPRTFSVTGPAAPGLTGFVGTSAFPFVVYGTSSCPIRFVDSTAAYGTCYPASIHVTGVSVVSKQLVYAVYQDHVLRYDGLDWTHWGPALPGTSVQAQAVWANTDTVVVAANQGQVYLANGGELHLQSGLPNEDYTAAWGFGSRDIWVGNDAGQLVHYDGSTWSATAQVDISCSGIRSLWGSKDTLYFTTEHAMGMIKGGAVQILHSYDCDSTTTVLGVWGNSNEEVFFATQDRTNINGCCAGVSLLWYDGDSMGPL